MEDPSLKVSEAGEGLGAGSGVLLSGLGELHVEVVTDRLIREFGCDVKVGEPSVAVKEVSEMEVDDSCGRWKESWLLTPDIVVCRPWPRAPCWEERRLLISRGTWGETGCMPQSHWR